MQLLEQINNLNIPRPELPPKLLAVRQTFDAPRIEDLAAAVRTALTESGLLGQIAPGSSVAVGVGSRGIANLPAIVKATIDCLREIDARPFIIPAMGSHGGATPEGQRGVLADLGVTPESVGAEIRATMEVKLIGQTPNGGPPLYQDVNAAAADHTLLINRVKPHTDFRSNLESGLAKMSLIGMGKQTGAAALHALGVPGFQKFLGPAARIYEKESNLLGGLALLENAYDDTAEIVGLTAAEIGGPREEALLVRATGLMASLPFPEIDVLCVRQLGKEISGTGMDTNIISRLKIPRQPENFGEIDLAVIAVLDLTEATHGNATGLGLAEVTTTRVVRQIDWASTYTNIITSGPLGIQRGGLPLTLPDDKTAIQVAVRGSAMPVDQARMVFIRDTLALDRLWISPSLQAAAAAHPRLTIEAEVPLAFDENGTMTSPWQLC